MPSKTPREPEVEVTEDKESGFIANIYDGEYLVQVRPHEDGYRLNLASKNGMGDAAFLRTYGREERFRRMLETEFDAIDEEAVFEVMEEHFADKEYRIVNLKEGIKHFGDRGADLYVETGETVPRLADERDYRDDQWAKEDAYRLRIWSTNDLWIEVQDLDSGNRIADYRPNSHLEDIQNEEKDEHERKRAPASVPGVHAPLSSSALDDAPVVHTHIDCAHLEQLDDTRFNPTGEKPPKVSAKGSGELPLRWCLTCTNREPTPDQLEEKYGP